MKTRLLALVGATAGLLLLAVHESTAANVSWSISVFEGPLGQCGQWVERPGYGRCWHPAYVDSDWRPYCDGYWMWTDCGWYWVSDEQWAWATYHYGRWVYDSYYGWVWVPDTEWGPSWVCWREGGEYVGWAPLPPGSGFGPEGHWREPAVSDRFFVFVGINHFSEPVHRRTVIVNNTTIINKTVNVTKITRVKNVVVNNGPDVKAIEKVSGRKLTVAPPRVNERRAVVKPGEPVPGVLKAAPDERREPRKQEQAGKREPEIIRGPPNVPQQPTETPVEPEHKQKKQEKQRIEPAPTQSLPSSPENPGHSQKNAVNPYGMANPSRNFESGVPRRFAPVEPDSIQPRQRMHRQELQQNQPPHDERGAVEKRGQSHREEGQNAKQKKAGSDSGD